MADTAISYIVSDTITSEPIGATFRVFFSPSLDAGVVVPAIPCLQDIDG